MHANPIYSPHSDFKQIGKMVAKSERRCASSNWKLSWYIQEALAATMLGNSMQMALNRDFQ